MRALPHVPRLRLLSAILLAALALLGLAKLADEFEDRGATLEQLLPRAEAEQLEQATAPFAKHGELVLVALVGQSGAWEDERLVALEHALVDIPGVAGAHELSFLRGKTRDPALRVLGVRIAGGALRLAEARRLDTDLAGVLANARHAGERAYAVGRPRLRAESWRLARRDLARLLPVLALLALGIPWVFLGSPGAGLFALLVAAVTSALTLWGYRLAAGPLNPLALLVVPLLWAIATTNALHFAGRVRAFAARGLALAECLRRARAELVAPCWTTTLTTAAGLGGMAAFGHAGLARELGFVSALGTLAAHPLTFVVCAPLAALAVGPTSPPRWPMALGLGLVRRARHAPRRWILAWCLLALVALVGLFRLRIANAFPHVFASGVGLECDLAHLAGALGTDLNPLEIVVVPTDEAGRQPAALLSAVLALAHELHAHPEVRLVLPNDGIEAGSLEGLEFAGLDPRAREAELERLFAREELAPWIDAAAGRALLQVHLAPTTWGTKNQLLDRIRHFGATMLGHHALRLAGTGYTTQRVEELGLRDLASGALLAAFAIAAVLGVALRNLRAWAIALASSTVPLLLVAGLMGLASIPWSVALLPLPGVLLGIALDDSIHLLWRPRGRERFAALPACLATTALVAGCLGTLAWGSLEANRILGSLLALGLGIALAADLTLLPALVRESRRRSPRPGP